MLSVITEGDTFASVWRDLAAELGLELRVGSSQAALSANGAPRPDPAMDPIPAIVVVAGREAEAEEDVRQLVASGHPAPLTVGSDPDYHLAIRLLSAGAGGYFVLPDDLSGLRSAFSDAVERARRRSDRERLGEVTRAEYDFSQIVGRSQPLRAALERASRIIPHPGASVLLTGETGTGKELFARAIHFNGPRRLGAFVEINCGAIPSNLLESELFGYERGAFTDARTAKPGLLEAADGGTLFLDEIGQTPLSLQGKLLKAIEEKRVRRLGSLRDRDLDLRLIAATHVDLAAAVRAGDFREDLYYRLTVIPIELPPLRERGDDILLLARHFLRTLADRYGMPEPRLEEGLARTLLQHSWPGNVRELRNTLERALLLGNGRLDPTDLFVGPLRSVRSIERGPIPFPATMDDIERHAARLMVDRFEGNKSAAAAALRISRSRLYRLLDEPEPQGHTHTPEPG